MKATWATSLRFPPGRRRWIPAKRGMDDLPKMRLFLYSRGDYVNRPADPKAVGHEGMGTTLREDDDPFEAHTADEVLTSPAKSARASGLAPQFIVWAATARHLIGAASFLMPKDFVRFKLTGKLGTDASDASGSGIFIEKTGRQRDFGRRSPTSRLTPGAGGSPRRRSPAPWRGHTVCSSIRRSSTVRTPWWCGATSPQRRRGTDPASHDFASPRR